MGNRQRLALPVLLLVALALAGCTAPAPGPVTVAEGAFHQATGAASGSVAIVRAPDGALSAILTGVEFDGGNGEAQLVSSDRVLDPDEACFESGELMPGPAPYEPGVEDVYLLPPTTERTSLAAFAIVVPADDDDAEQTPPGCLVRLVGFANLDWGRGIR
jgi:hypothetical protein